MGSLSPCSICPIHSPFQVQLPVTMLFIGYSWRARYGNPPWAGASESVSSLLYQEEKKLCVSSCVLGLLGIGGASKSHHPRQENTSQPGLASPPLVLPDRHFVLLLVPLLDFHWAVTISTKMNYNCAVGLLQSSWATLQVHKFLGLMT